MRRVFDRVFPMILGLALAASCSSGEEPDPTPILTPASPKPLPPLLAAPWTTEVRTINVVHGKTPLDFVVLGGDWTQPGAPVIKDEVPADSRREVLTRASMLETVASAGDGHGRGLGRGQWIPDDPRDSAGLPGGGRSDRRGRAPPVGGGPDLGLDQRRFGGARWAKRGPVDQEATVTLSVVWGRHDRRS